MKPTSAQQARRPSKLASASPSKAGIHQHQTTVKGPAARKRIEHRQALSRLVDYYVSPPLETAVGDDVEQVVIHKTKIIPGLSRQTLASLRRARERYRHARIQDDYPTILRLSHGGLKSLLWLTCASVDGRSTRCLDVLQPLVRGSPRSGDDELQTILWTNTYHCTPEIVPLDTLVPGCESLDLRAAAAAKDENAKANETTEDISPRASTPPSSRPTLATSRAAGFTPHVASDPTPRAHAAPEAHRSSRICSAPGSGAD
ncbi:MAG: hypothetical protein M1826_002056 [Phylliscum demangeonii]|nr:MAG: hypothetical protein M1826_002056 [Phylliscum demangeonii]